MKKELAFARLTVSVPQSLHDELGKVRQNLGISQSELIKRACELLIEQQRKLHWQAAAQKMAHYYETDPELNAFRTLDSDDFT